MIIPVVDIFAGPGGLGEGFSAYRALGDRAARGFRIAVSAEKDVNAWRTLRLRAFFRQFEPGEVPNSYYQYLRGQCPTPYTAETQIQWEAASAEAHLLTLGSPRDDQRLDELVAKVAGRGKPWILIGGPPCQAYSLVGRSRNRGISGYTPEADERHFLYEHYLRLIARFQPAAFIMENVKGILSASVGGERIFQRILDDLHHPRRNGLRYRIIPLVRSSVSPDLTPRPSDFIVRAEDYGVPQARHRVILLGVREDIARADAMHLRPSKEASMRDAIGDLPPLRSGSTSSKRHDCWARVTAEICLAAARKTDTIDRDVSRRLKSLAKQIKGMEDPGRGGSWISCPRRRSSGSLGEWYGDQNLHGHANHETRSHMDKDLERYAFAASFAEVRGRSPRAVDFPEELAPDHRNWGSGKFVDRFKVQLPTKPSSTITSHLSKDGHYFIHPDPAQMRSLTVREAARLQTFPDNYFFEGTRGRQFQQVGNAVPPWLAYQIAGVVHQVIAGGLQRSSAEAAELSEASA